jgi:polyisoprenoid-binding protein YceI
MKILKLIAWLAIVAIVSMQTGYAGTNDDNKSGKKAVILKADTQKSVVKWSGKKVTGEHNGTVSMADGSLQVENGKLKGGSFEIDMNSITNADLTDVEYNAKLVGHLKSDDFFAVDKHPKAVFKITKATPVTNAKADAENYTITGDLTIKGITHSITFPANVKITDNKAEATAKFDVDRTKYDIKFRSGNFFQNLGDNMIYDNFTIDLKLVANEEARIN